MRSNYILSGYVLFGIKYLYVGKHTGLLIRNRYGNDILQYKTEQKYRQSDKQYMENRTDRKYRR